MIQPPELSADVWALFDAACADELKPDDVTRLDALLRDDQRLRDLYLDYFRLHAELFRTVRLDRARANIHAAVRGLRAEVMDQGSGISGKWPVVSGQGVESRESRVENGGEWPESLDSRIPNPEIPVINLQIPTLNSRLSTLNSWTFSYSVATVLLAVALLGAWSYTITHPDPDSLATNNSRMAMSSGSAAGETPEFTFVGHVSGMVGCQWADEATATYAGAAVALNRRYALHSGLMEITYDSGAKVILQGPCDYTVESPRGGFLKVGKLTAMVESRASRVESAKPQAAIPESPNFRIPNPKSPTPHAPRPTSLFSVRTPTALVEDLGTEFGVEVLQSGETASHVFQGKVVVRIEGAGDETSKSPNLQISKSEILLSAGQSARVEKDAKSGEMKLLSGKQLAPDDGVRFARQLPQPTPIKLFNTGVGLKEGDPDPHWQIVARSDQIDFKPQAAVVTSHPPVMLPNDPGRSQWISTAGNMPEVPNDTVYTFRTTFDLAGRSLKDVVLRGRFLVDNHVDAIRLNGRDLHVPEHSCTSAFNRFQEFIARNGFVEGTNILEIDVYNGDYRLRAPRIGFMGCRVELELFARGNNTAIEGDNKPTIKQQKGEPATNTR
jgi:hypothetical protein